LINSETSKRKFDFNPIDSVMRVKGPILVLGAGGFIGANLLRILLSLRQDVFGTVRHGNSWRLQGIDRRRIIRTDLNDKNETRETIDKVLPRTVFDCVAYGAYPSQTERGLIYETNFNSLLFRTDYLMTHDLSAYIHAGSSSEYGYNCSGPDENDVLSPNSDYAVSKIAASKLLSYLGKAKGFPCLNLRLYSVYGEYEDPSRLIPTLMQHVMKGEFPSFVQPEISRDFVYVKDVCQAFFLSAANISPDLHGESLNIGTGMATTIKQLAELVKYEYSIEAVPRFSEMDNRPWDLSNWYSKPAKALETIGWKACTSLLDGLGHVQVWLSNIPTDLQVSFQTPVTASNAEKSISAIVACYRDAQALPEMYERLTDVFCKLGVKYEIIFVNDGSPDDTEVVLQRIAARDFRVVLVNHSRNFGSQMAFLSGMELSRMNAVVLLDGDLQDPPELISEFYQKWCRGYDVVYGIRLKREMAWTTELAYKTFYKIFNRLSYINVPRDAGDFSLIDRKVVNWLLKFGERDVFIRGLRAYVGFSQTGVDYFRPKRKFGLSTNNMLRNLEWAKKGIFSFSEVPLTLLTNVGALTFLASFVFLVVIIVLRMIEPSIAPRGATTILAVGLFFGSVNLLAVGLVGEYVSKIMIEAKARPRFIRRSITRDGIVSSSIDN